MQRMLITILLGLLAWAGPAAAQLALPGAVAPSATGSVEKLYKPKKAVRAGPRPAPGISTIVGRPLLLNGGAGLLQFSAKGNALRVEKFKLIGEVISDATQQCSIDVVGATPIETKGLAKPDGLARFAADIPSCAFTFDVLDGAVLSPPQTEACVFKAADCQASPAGLWGPDGASLAKDSKTIERSRARAESEMVASFKELEARLKDASKAKGLARDQAGFSSQREEACRDYSHEAAHGFCATRLTEARAAYLHARGEELPQVAKAR